MHIYTLLCVFVCIYTHELKKFKKPGMVFFYQQVLRLFYKLVMSFSK